MSSTTQSVPARAVTPPIMASVNRDAFQQIPGNNQPVDIARIVASATDRVAMPPIENFNIQNAQKVFVQVHVNEHSSYRDKFLSGAASSAGGTLMILVLYKAARVVTGMFEGGTSGAAVAGPAGAIAGVFVGGAIGLVV